MPRDSSAPMWRFCMVGAFARHTVVDQATIVVIDKRFPFDLASLVACAPAGVGAARNARA